MKSFDENKVSLWLKISLTVLAVFLSIYLLADHVLPIAGRFVSFFAPVLLPFIIAFVLSILLEPMIGLFEKRLKLKRGLAVVFVLLVVLLLIAVVFGALISRLIVEISSLMVTFSNLNLNVEEIVADVERFYSTFLINFADVQTIQEGIKNFVSSFSELGLRFLNGFVSILKSTPTTFIMLLVALLSTYFFCKDKNMVLNFLLKLTPASKKEHIANTYGSAVKAFSGYFRAQITVISVTAILCMIGYAILGLDYVFTMGILTGLFDILPVLGPGTLIIPWAIWSLISGDITVAIGLIVVYAVITISRQFLEPKLVSQNIGLHPLATIAAIFIGMQLFGVIGLICGPIVLVIITGFFKAAK